MENIKTEKLKMMGLLENSGENITNWLIDDDNNSDDVNGSEQENNDSIDNKVNKKSNWT